ncbi:MAG: hypothetical protein IJZ29_01720 [Clostridia bacterium]|nr:hypothetical protein [Clostridia bacterium]
MKKIILISPIGDTDPIRNGYDGPLLHISRQYKPDKIYLLLTEEMYKRHLEDNRYLNCLNQLYKGISANEKGLYEGHHKEFELIPKRLYVEDASNFEAFKVFTNIIDGIVGENGDCEYYVNITSGTPQIISTLCLDLVVNNRKMKAIQVTTPEKKSNANVPHSSGVEENALINVFDSYVDTYTNRCREVELRTFRKSSCYLKVKSFVEDYNYFYALNELEKETFEIDAKLIDLCGIGNKYQNSDFENVKTKCKIANFYCNSTSDTDLRNILNSYNVMQIKEKKNLITDFTVRLTPILYLLSKKLVSDVFDLSKITIKTNNGLRLILDKIKDNDVSDVLNEVKYDTFLATKHLIDLYEHFGCNEKVLNTLKLLRSVEDSIRNKVAHEITYVSKSDYKTLTNTTPLEVLHKLRELILHAYPNNTKDEDYIFFERLNIEIINELKLMLKSN